MIMLDSKRLTAQNIPVLLNLKRFSERLRQSAISKGYLSPTQLAKALRKAKFDVTAAGVKNHWYSVTPPNSATVVGYHKVLGISIDWLLTGQDPPLPQLITDMTRVLERARSEGLLPSSDPQIAEYMEAITGLTPAQRKIIIDLAVQLKQSRNT